MSQYILRRLVLFIPAILGISLLVFLMIWVIPGDVVDAKFGDEMKREDLLAFKEKLGLARPIHEQYLRWLWGALRGDFGMSFWKETPVLEEIALAAPITVELALLGTAVSLLVAIPAGILAAIRQDTWMDHASRVVAIAGLAIPSFWLGTLLLFGPSVLFTWTPPAVYRPLWEDPWSNLQQFAFPALALGFYFAALTMRMTRSCVLEVLRQDYVRTAWAKGLAEFTVTMRHVLKNASIPVLTLVGFEFGHLLAGSVIIETIFTLPGVGRLVLDSIRQRDFVLLQGAMVIIAGVFLTTNLFVDLLYAYLDPRIRYR